MDYQIIEDWRLWSKIGVMPKKARCALNNTSDNRTLSPYFTEDDLLSFDQKIAALSQKYPLSVKVFKMRYLYGLTYSKIGKSLKITPQKAKKAADSVISKALNVTYPAKIRISLKKSLYLQNW